MKEFTQIENHAVEIWRRPYQRSLRLSVRSNGHLRVTCGRRIPKRAIVRFVLESRDFIEKRLKEVEELRSKHPIKKYISGENFLFFGELRPLDIVWTWEKRCRVRALESSIEMKAPLNSTREERALALRRFFKSQARLHFSDRMSILSAQMQLRPTRVCVRGQQTRWGSCSARAEINLNWKLLAAPVDVIDYVIVHELAHIRHMNHSPDFWALVERSFPDFRAAKRWLRKHEYEIGIQFEN